MIEHFNELSSEDKDILIQAISDITIYVAGCDGKLDQEEITWAKKVSHIRSYKGADEIRGFYNLVGETFSFDLNEKVRCFNHGECTVEKNLNNVSSVLGKMDPKLAAKFYKNFKSFAKHVAKASGGFLGFGSINSKESDAIKLKMINEIVG